MTDDRRMSTVRFYGSIDNRLEILTDLLSYLDAENGVSAQNAVQWVLSNTNAENPSTIEDRLGFLEGLGLIESEDGTYRCTQIGECYLRERDPVILYNALRSAVKGFDTIVRALAVDPQTDDDLMDLLVGAFEQCNMETPGVATRHREWLQMIGYVEHTGDQNRLTAAGEAVADQLNGVSGVHLVVDEVYDRGELHRNYGGQVQGGISPSSDEPVVFLFTGSSGEEHGYQDELRHDGTALYTGEGQVGDMEMLRGNRVIRDHVEEGRELHFFEMEDEGVRYLGQFLYAGYIFEELPDSQGDLRRGIRFELAPVAETGFGDAATDAVEGDWAPPEQESDDSQEGDPTVYQVPVKAGEGPIRTNYERTVLEGVPRERVADIYEPPVDHDTFRVWGNQEDEPADRGDYLLFADRKGRREGEYTVLAKIADATVLDAEKAEQFTDAVGWGEVTDQSFPHVMFLDPVYEAELDRAAFWETMGFKGWPNDTYSGIDVERDGSRFSEKYGSIESFIETAKGRRLYPDASSVCPGTYDSLDAALDDLREKLSGSPEGKSWLTDRIGKVVIEEWSEALTGFQPSDEVAPVTAARLDQLRAVYEALEPDLERKADELGVDSLGTFSPATTLFLGWIRIIQDDLGVPEPLNQSRLNSVLHDTYSVRGLPVDSGRQKSVHLHPVAEHIRDAEPVVHMFTAPPDYWLTAVRRRAIAFEPDHEEVWEKVTPGDVALFHSTQEPGNPELESQPSGFIGAAILGRKARKDDAWWWDENNGHEFFPMLVGFERLFITAAPERLDSSKRIEDQSDDDIESALSVLTDGLLPFSEANDLSIEVSGDGLQAQGSHISFTVDGDRPADERPRALIEALAPQLTEVAPVDIYNDVAPEFSPDVLDGLHFPDNAGEEILDEIEAAIRSGKHVILTGPPGTGKTEIAERVANELAESYPNRFSGFQITTATADWSTFDTVGGYMPSETTGENDDDSLSFTPGTILNRLRDSTHDVPVNEPLVIDELNRADIDKAFGQLFTVLSGQSVTLPYTKGGREIELLPVSDLEGDPQSHQYAIPNSWRILATMNTYDKTSLYEMSYAFMRRFAFVRVGVPDLDGSLLDLMNGYVSAWENDDLEIGLDEDELHAVGRVWRKTNSAVDERAIGPAIVRDLVLYLVNHDERDLQTRLTRAVIAYVFPQLEGVPKRRDIIENIVDSDAVNGDQLRDAGREMLQITFEEA